MKDFLYEDSPENTPLIFMKTEFDKTWRVFCKKAVYPYEKFRKIQIYELTVNTFKKEDLFSTIKNGYPDDE